MNSRVQSYQTIIIRELLLASFTAEGLRHFCRDRPEFRPILDRFGPGLGFDEMVDRVIAYCDKQALLDELLAQVREVNPRQYALFEPALPMSASALTKIPCPYRGLEPFEAEHAEFYFGREAMVERLLDQLSKSSLVAVVGPSGSGKSSLVRAGLMTALREGALPGCQAWGIRIFRPGGNPLRSLCGPLVDLLEPEASEVTRLAESGKLAKAIAEGAVTMTEVAVRLRDKHPEMPCLLLIADQFEELYTECKDEELQESFIKALLEASGHESVAVVLTLRGDFYGHALGTPGLGQAVDAGLVNLLPMTEEELRAAIEMPAKKVGREFEPGLVERILEDIEGQPGNLPLMEFALTALWENQTASGLLTHVAYEATGEVKGSIAQRAETVFRELAQKGKGDTARRIFLQLTYYGEGAEGTRRRALVDDLVTPKTARMEVESTIQALADARLLVTGGEAPKMATAEVSHEALIRGWGRLDGWLKEDRAFGLWREKLAGVRRTWEETDRDEGALLRGAPLMEAAEWLDDRGDDLHEAERVFIEESLALQARSRRRSRWTAVALGVLALLVFCAVAFSAVLSWNSAIESEAARSAAESGATAAALAMMVAQDLLGTQEAALVIQLQPTATGVAQDVLPTQDLEATQAAVRAALAAHGATQTAFALAPLDHVLLSRRLAAESSRQLELENYEGALPLAIEAGRAADTSEARVAVHEALSQLAGTPTAFSGGMDGSSQCSSGRGVPTGPAQSVAEGVAKIRGRRAVPGNVSGKAGAHAGILRDLRLSSLETTVKVQKVQGCEHRVQEPQLAVEL